MDWKDGIKGGPFSPDQLDKLISAFSGLSSEQIQWLSGYLAGRSNASIQQSASQQEQNAFADKSTSDEVPLLILYGTQTGNSEKLALHMEKCAQSTALKVTTKSMAEFKGKDLKKVTNLAIIVSTQGIGEPPVQAEELYNFLHSKRAPKLDHLRYTVLALGDTGYAQFCQTGKDFDHVLEKLGAERICKRVDCDIDYEDDASAWIDSVLKTLQKSVSTGSPTPSVNFQQNGSGHQQKPQYNRKNPFEAPLLDKVKLNGRGSSKETIHLEIGLEGSGITYQPGDALGIYAHNSERLVDSILETLQFSGTEEVETHQGTSSLRNALTYDYELTPLTALTLNKYAELTGSSKLENTLAEASRVSDYLYGRDIIDLFKETPSRLSPQELISVLRKNTARMYSIASCQEAYEDEVHALVSVIRYHSHGRAKEGLCSTYLADQLTLEDDKVKLFVEENNKFRLPEDEQTPIIMVGPGTGVAPFRAFMQQREMNDNPGKAWLFFGDRNFTTDFLYQTEWLQYLKDGLLTKVDVAFSRDSHEKVYVQHKMWENGKGLYDWLESGAHFYVCGDAIRMAKDVEKTLKDIIKTHGHQSSEQADEYVKYLQLSGRYQTDVY
ncbi:sulfite reductase (NADPH) flavoprotein alpha-component [Catalinimonas alkaloidigena]|uniref:assimilatory sulfite reductase (NADPH) flavoprotein subunit n=1 Tax=Catalinimonas alkaloidigena TaxID=1075417 RepID=UPI0024049D8A|nr:assimilatory sulfite reductase (NADPH) flavoprotein subunit [Catalinimonas alkaloidigena]MDF9796491.1 sulfite reductase (NADPH) flavoprotein alpha-component [Catalinimonas alkaloidigena]